MYKSTLPNSYSVSLFSISLSRYVYVSFFIPFYHAGYMNDSKHKNYDEKNKEKNIMPRKVATLLSHCRLFCCCCYRCYWCCCICLFVCFVRFGYEFESFSEEIIKKKKTGMVYFSSLPLYTINGCWQLV